MTLDGYSEDATLGYTDYLKVFLTHSALERFKKASSHVCVPTPGPKETGLPPGYRQPRGSLDTRIK